MLRLLLLGLLYFLLSEESDSLNDEYDDDGSDYESSGTYSFPAFSLHFENSVGRVSGLGSGVFVPTGVDFKYDILALVVFVPIGVEFKCGQLIKKIGAQIPCSLSKFLTQFCSYSHGMTLPHSFLLLPLYQKHDPARSNGIYR